MVQLIELDHFFVFGDEDALVEGLLGEVFAQVVGALVHRGLAGTTATAAGPCAKVLK